MIVSILNALLFIESSLTDVEKCGPQHTITVKQKISTLPGTGANSSWYQNVKIGIALTRSTKYIMIYLLLYFIEKIVGCSAVD